jgi:hypothetical protein
MPLKASERIALFSRQVPYVPFRKLLDSGGHFQLDPLAVFFPACCGHAFAAIG